jgi:predicted HTH domain antitoxin
VVAGGDGIPAPDTTMAEAVATASPTTSEATSSDPAASTGPTAGALSSAPQMAAATASAGADDNTVEDPKVTMGHPGLRVPGAVSLSEVMGLSHFVLNQVHDVLRREREEINEERLCLSVLVSLLKKRMTSEKEMAEARQKHLNVMEILLDRRQAVANKLDTQAQKLLNDAKELYTLAEDRANATIK